MIIRDGRFTIRSVILSVCLLLLVAGPVSGLTLAFKTGFELSGTVDYASYVGDSFLFRTEDGHRLRIKTHKLTKASRVAVQAGHEHWQKRNPPVRRTPIVPVQPFGGHGQPSPQGADWQFVAGLGMADVNGWNVADIVRPILAHQLGILFTVSESEHVSYQVGALWTAKGFSLNRDVSEAVSINNTTLTETHGLGYLVVPVLITVRPSPDLYVEGGGFVATLLSSRVYQELRSPGYRPSITSFDTHDYRTLDYGWSFGAGVTFHRARMGFQVHQSVVSLPLTWLDFRNVFYAAGIRLFI